MDTIRDAACARCGGLVVIGEESSHPCGVYVQHGRCAACGVRLWRLLDGLHVPVPDSRGRWTAAPVGAGHAVTRMSRRAERAMRPARPAGPAGGPPPAVTDSSLACDGPCSVTPLATRLP